MTAFRIESNRDGAFAVVDRTSRPEYFSLELRTDMLQAAVEFYEPGYRPMAVFFAELADLWRGWDGERTWGSLEGEVGLSATHDKFGTVVLTVDIRSDTYEPVGGYLSAATGKLLLDAGRLDVLALHAAQRTA